MKINLMVPTYKRIAGLNTFVTSAMNTASDKDNLYFTVLSNVNDTATHEAVQDLQAQYGNIEMITEDTEQPNLSLFWNMLYERTSCKDAIVSMVADDMEFVTVGWDQRVLNEIESRDGAAVVYLNDDYIAKEKLCVNLFTTRKMVEASKKPFMCEQFHADMIDLVWYFVGISTSTLVYLDDVVLRHNHETRKPPARRDENHARLAPIQALYRNPQSSKYAMAYATICAKNIIDAGIGRWNTL